MAGRAATRRVPAACKRATSSIRAFVSVDCSAGLVFCWRHSQRASSIDLRSAQRRRRSCTTLRPQCSESPAHLLRALSGCVAVCFLSSLSLSLSLIHCCSRSSLLSRVVNMSSCVLYIARAGARQERCVHSSEEIGCGVSGEAQPHRGRRGCARSERGARCCACGNGARLRFYRSVGSPPATSLQRRHGVRRAHTRSAPHLASRRRDKCAVAVSVRACGMSYSFGLTKRGARSCHESECQVLQLVH